MQHVLDSVSHMGMGWRNDTPYEQGGIIFLNSNRAVVVGSTLAMCIHGDFRVLKCQDHQLHWSLVDTFCTWKPGL